MSSPFTFPVDLARTALLLSDVQTQILGRFPKDVQDDYLSHVKTLLDFFRADIAARRAAGKPADSTSRYDDVPMIIHHTLPFNLNSNAFVSPYNKLAKWVAQLEAAGYFANAPSDPHRPNYSVPESITPPQGWGGKDEIVLGKLQPSCFGSSDLLAYLRARGIQHIVLVSGVPLRGSSSGVLVKRTRKQRIREVSLHKINQTTDNISFIGWFDNHGKCTWIGESRG